jgi:MFS family permease
MACFTLWIPTPRLRCFSINTVYVDRIVNQSTKPPSLLEPLSNPGFSTIWAANSLSLMAFWMTEVACAWQMRIMTDADPLLVASVYTALQLPIVLLVIPAGVLTDLADRRRVMIWTHVWLGFGLGALFWLTVTERITPLLLLVVLPLIAVGQALRMPGIATLIPDLVSTQQIPAAVSLNSMAQTSSRIVGPALAGAIIASTGIAAVLAVNASIMILIIFLFLRLSYRPEKNNLPLSRQRFFNAVTEGLRFAAATRWKRNILIRLGTFFACSAAVPALMAVRFDDSETYGFMYACFGGGSLLGLLIIGKLGHQELDRRLTGALFACALFMMLFGLTDRPALAALLLAGIGASWIFCSNSIMVAAQMQLDSSMRGRGLSFIFAVGTACLAGGGLLWGTIARATSPSSALVASGVCLLLLLAVTYRLSIAAPKGLPASLAEEA